MTDFAIRQLACAVTMQAVKDYIRGSAGQKKAVLKDLRSPYMDFLTNGTSVVVARELELHPDEIAKRVRNCEED